MKPGTIIHERGNYFVRKAAKGYELYESGPTVATRRGIYGEQDKYLAMAIDRCNQLAGETETQKGLRAAHARG